MSESQTKHTLQIFWRHAKKHRLSLSIMFASMIGATFLEVYVPFLYKQLFNALAAGGPALSQAIAHIIWQIFAINLVLLVVWRTYWLCDNYFYPRTMSDLLNTCFEYLQKHSYNFFNNNFAGSLVRRVNRYPKAFEEIYDQFVLNIGQALLRIGTILVVLYFQHWVLALLIGIWALAYTMVNIFLAQYKMKFDVERAAMDTKVTGRLADVVSNNINLKLFGGLRAEISMFADLSAGLSRLRRRSGNVGIGIESVQAFFMVLLELGVLFVAFHFWREGLLTIGDFALLQAYLMQIFNSLRNVGRHIRRLYESLADAAEMTQILTMPYEVADKSGAAELRVAKGLIEFQHVTFHYHENKDVYKNFNLVIQPGERVALIGPSGGGKSTITKLLFRFFDIQGGSILIDDQNIAEVTQESLRHAIALVPQDPILFHRTLMENIRYARASATDMEVMEAAKLAHCHEFIEEFPEKYETYVGERGVKLSGGERQRVAIARAILKDVPILVLDEATSSLDSESEALIQDALGNLMKGKTTIVIAHRLSTIMQMDRIIVIEHGRIVEEGKHEELIKAEQGVYQKLWEIQAGGFAA
jgi:ATP-binding cassette subfamily B protein